MANKILGFPRPESLLQLADGSTDHEFRGQDALAEGHSWMMQPLKKHLHTGFADLFFVDANGRKRRVHQNGLFTIIEPHQADIVRHFHGVPLQRSPQPVGDLVVARYGSSGPWPPGQDSRDAALT